MLNLCEKCPVHLGKSVFCLLENLENLQDTILTVTLQSLIYTLVTACNALLKFLRAFSVSLKFLKKHEMLARGSLQFQNLTEVKGKLCKTGKVVRKRHFYFLLLKTDIYFCIHCYLFLVPSQLRITINNEKVILCFNYRNERCPERIVSI